MCRIITTPRGLEPVPTPTVSEAAGPAGYSGMPLAHKLGGLWFAWPKKTSKVLTDMTEDVARPVAGPLDLVASKVCAIDDTWSGLGTAWCGENR